MRYVAVLAVLAALTGPSALALQPAAPEVVSDQVIVRFKDGVDLAADRGAKALDTRFFELGRPLVAPLNLYTVRLKSRMSIRQALDGIRANPKVMYAQADHKLSWRERPSRMPNDPDMNKLWNMSKIAAPEAWALGTGGKDKNGNDVVIAIVDGGIDATHPDIRDNLWTNRGEIEGNGLDDDGNGYIDDIHGWNAYAHNGEIPVASHGTHVAGIAGARGDNAVGIAGVNWNVQIMPVAASSGTTSVVAEGYGYVLAQKKLWLATKGAKGANVVATNSSFGVDYGDCAGGEYPMWNDLYDQMGKVGILSAAATANMNIDVDKVGDVPTGCKSQYLITVTNTDNADARSSEAGYGLTTIAIGAPGENIFSLVPVSEGSTGIKSGTSMATPHVTGAIALLHTLAGTEFAAKVLSDPAAAALQLKAALLGGVDELPSLKGKTISGGRLNVMKSVLLLGGGPVQPARVRAGR